MRDRIRLTSALFETGQERAEDTLYCDDGSCGRCQVIVDGVKRLACRTDVHRGMNIKLKSMRPAPKAQPHLCSCMGVTREKVIERIQQGNLRSPEAVLAMTHVGEGKCHGQGCQDAFRRVLSEQGIDASQWIDWRFPWSDWVLNPAPHE